MVINLADDGPSPAPFRILVVSDRNVARGPAAQRLLRAHLAATGRATGVVVGTAGARAPIGAGLHPLMARVLAEAGIDTRGHTARQVTERRLAQADLVLLTAPALRHVVTALWPPVATVTFTVHEFARLGAEEVPDPGDDPAAHARVLERLDRALQEVAAAVAARAPGAGVAVSGA